MALDTEDVQLIGDMISERINSALDKFRADVDPDVKLDREFTRRERKRHERCSSNRQLIINGILIAVGAAVVLGILNFLPAIIKLWAKTYGSV